MRITIGLPYFLCFSDFFSSFYEKFLEIFFSVILCFHSRIWWLKLIEPEKFSFPDRFNLYLVFNNWRKWNQMVTINLILTNKQIVKLQIKSPPFSTESILLTTKKAQDWVFFYAHIFPLASFIKFVRLLFDSIISSQHILRQYLIVSNQMWMEVFRCCENKRSKDIFWRHQDSAKGLNNQCLLFSHKYPCNINWLF